MKTVVDALPAPLRDAAAKLSAMETLTRERALVVMPFGLSIR